MKIKISDTPASEAGTYISNKLRSVDNEDILVLLSGGSAMKVLDCIDPFILGPHVTFMMMDERFSEDPLVNNYLQLRNTPFFKKIEQYHAQVIDTSTNSIEISLGDAALAVRKTLEYLFKLKPRIHVLGLFGIGEDGHTASIFPKPSEEEFNAIYRTNELFIPIVEHSNPYKERMTITPYFIKNYVNETIIFAVGEEKCNGVLKNLQEGSHTENELPALIPANHQNSILFTDCEDLK